MKQIISKGRKLSENKQKKRILAIIPARAGSKGLKNKNIKSFLGKPLIIWTIKTALKSKMISDIIISTNDPEVISISKKNKIKYIRRPKQIATDKAPIIETIKHVLVQIRYKPDIIILLQPTSPLRNKDDIDKSLLLLTDNKYDSIISVSEQSHSPYWCFTIKNKIFKPLFKKRVYFRMRRQDLPRIYSPNGAIFCMYTDSLLKNNSFYTLKTGPYIMPVERSIDIDTEIDFFIAEKIFEAKLWRKK